MIANFGYSRNERFRKCRAKTMVQKMKIEPHKSQIVIYKTENGNNKAPEKHL